MLVLTIGDDELFDEATNQFTVAEGIVIRLEHSLVSLSKWESIHEKAFLGPEPKTIEESKSYIKCMLLDETIDPEVIEQCSPEKITQIQEYIQSAQSATRFGNLPNRGGPNETITSELIYWWLTALTIPWQPAESWHLNRLFSLVKIANIKNDPKGQKKMPRHEIAQQYRDENARRRAEYGTSG